MASEIKKVRNSKLIISHNVFDIIITNYNSHGIVYYLIGTMMHDFSNSCLKWIVYLIHVVHASHMYDSCRATNELNYLDYI